MAYNHAVVGLDSLAREVALALYRVKNDHAWPVLGLLGAFDCVCDLVEVMAVYALDVPVEAKPTGIYVVHVYDVLRIAVQLLTVEVSEGYEVSKLLG